MKKDKNNLSRRNFLKNTTVGLSGTILLSTIISSCTKGVNDRILIGHIGLGSRGQSELKNYFVPLSSSCSVATCDTFDQRRRASADRMKCSFYYKG